MEQRKIAFRAWDGTKMQYRDFAIEAAGTVFNALAPSNSGRSPIKLDWIPMQFTGLTDKNGKEIYEGDIVRHKQVKKPYIIQWTTFEDGEFGFPEGIGFNVHPEMQNEIEVIGNIYENSDLLN